MHPETQVRSLTAYASNALYQMHDTIARDWTHRGVDRLADSSAH